MAEPSRPSAGISNRQSPQEEQHEREQNPPLDSDAPAASEAGSGEVQTSGKAGSRSTAQKESESKYSDRGMPATSRTDGAFGREPNR